MKANKLKTPFILFLLITLGSAFIFCPYLFGKTAFVLGWDMRTLYSSNFEALRTMLQNLVQKHELPFWSWVSFLGNDYYSSKLFYFQDPFDYPFALTNWSYTSIIMIETYLKFLVAGFGFYAYARGNRYSAKTSLISALIFAFSAYNLQTMMHPFFGSFFVFLPLYFLSIDRYITEGRKGWFIFWVFFLFVNNYYLFYSVSLFTILYFIWRYYRQHHTCHNLMKSAWKLIGCYLIGCLLSGFAVVPEVLAILANSRVGSRSTALVYSSILPYLEYLCGLFTPTSVLANRGTEISSLYSYTTANHSVMAVFLWSSSITTLLVPQLFSRKNRQKLDLILAAVITAIALIPALSSIMHGFSEPSFRWLGSVSFLLVAAILPLIEDPTRIDKPLLKKCIWIFAALLAVTTPLLALATGTSFQDLLSDYPLVLLFLPTLIATGWAIYHDRQKVVLISTVIELCLACFFSFYGCPAFASVSKQDNDRATRIMGSKNEFNTWLLLQDGNNANQFYRTYIDPEQIYWQLSTNFNLDFNIRGLLSYDSTYHASANDLKKLSGQVESYLPWTFDVEDPNLMNLLSVKYAVVTSEDHVPFENYRLLGNYYTMQVYENLDYCDLGKTYSQVISYDEYDSSDTSAVTQTVICHAEDLTEIRSLLGSESVSFMNAVAEGNSMYADISTSQAGFAVLSVPYDQGWHVTVNGQSVKTYEVNGGLTGIALPAGYSEIQMHFTPHGLKAGVIATACGGLLLLAGWLLQRRKNRLNPTV